MSEELKRNLEEIEEVKTIAEVVSGREVEAETDPLEKFRSRAVSKLICITLDKVKEYGIRKPSGKEFFMVHPESNLEVPWSAYSHELDKKKVLYLVADTQVRLIPEFVKDTIVFAWQDANRTTNFWGYPCDDSEGKLNSWHRSALVALPTAKKHFVRLVSDQGLGKYVEKHPDDLDFIEAPVWPDVPYEKMLMSAFKDNLIDIDDHPLIKELRGKK